MNILLIEPDVILGKIYSDYLVHYGHTTFWEQNAQGAITSADQCPPDIVVLELLLPSHNGLEFLYEFRSYGEWQTTPIIVHSLLLPNQLPVSAQRQLGVNLYLYKPQTTMRQLEHHLSSHVLTTP